MNEKLQAVIDSLTAQEKAMSEIAVELIQAGNNEKAQRALSISKEIHERTDSIKGFIKQLAEK